MSPIEKAKYIDTFLRGLSEASFPSSLANILELDDIPSDKNKSKFKALEFILEKNELVIFIKGRDNSTLDGQCKYFISSKGEEYVTNNKSTLELFLNENKTEQMNWNRAFNRLFKIINGTAYMSGSEFLNVAREIDDSLPSYNKYIEHRRTQELSTSRQDFFNDIINDMNEEQKHDFYKSIILDLEKTVSSDELNSLKELFTSEHTPVIKKRDVPNKNLPNEVYKDVLKTLHNAYRSAEQKPSIYEGKNEESLRDYGLAILESRYENIIPAGEAFNKNGKTDIILKTDDNINLFVAECKVWRGPGQIHEALNQLFGYLTWRDSKSTLIFFVHNADFTKTLATLKEEAEKHPLFLEFVEGNDETRLSYIFKHKDDPERKVQVEIMAFHFPKTKTP